MSGRVWMDRVGRPLLVGVMAACVVAALVQLIARVAPSWHDNALPLFCGLSALEAMYSAQFLEADHHALLHGRGPRVLEFGSLAVCRQLWVPFFGGSALLWAHFPQLDLGAMTGSIASFLPIAGTWLIAIQMAASFRMLDAGDRRPARSISPAASLGVLILEGGGVVAAATLLLRVPAGGAPSAFHTMLPWLLLLYVMLAVILLADVRFSSLSHTWGLCATRMAPEVPQTWINHGGPVVAGALAVALLVPMAGHVGTIRFDWRDVEQAIRSTGSDIELSLPHGSEKSPFEAAPAVSRPFPPRPSEHVHEYTQARYDPPAAPDGGSGISIPADTILRDLRFVLPWLLVVASVAYRFRRRRKSAGRGNDVMAFISALFRGVSQALLAWPRFLRGYARPGSHLRAVACVPEVPQLAPRIRPRRIRLPLDRTPRDRLIRSYDDVVRTAARRGLSGPPGESPREFAELVTSAVPVAGDDMGVLARRYVEARYSRRMVDAHAAREVQQAAKRVRKSLRRASREGTV